MKTKRIAIALFFGIIPLVIFSQPDNIIELKPGKPIKVDGIIGTNEWTDADSMFIEIDTNWISTVYYKNDGSHVLFAFKNLEKVIGKAQSVNLFIDKSNNKSANWDSNDLWLHASYSDCEAIGNYYVWNNCSLTKPDWLANNQPFNGNDNVEMQINFSKFDLKALPDTFGFAISLSRDTIYNFWPKSANNDHPSTWGYLIFPKNTAGNNEIIDKENQGIKIFPNPSNGIVNISFGTKPVQKSLIEIYNLQGILVFSEIFHNDATSTFNLSGYPRGVYLTKLYKEGEIINIKLCLD